MRTRPALQTLESRTVPALVALAAGAGGGPAVQLYDPATGESAGAFFAYEATYTGGVRLAMGDVTGDGVADIVTGTGTGGGPLVKIFDGETAKLLGGFLAYGQDFRGGVNVAVGDATGDGVSDIVTAAGPGGGPHVKVFDAKTFRVLGGFFAFPGSFSGGVSVAVGDTDPASPGDEIVAAAGAGGGPAVSVFAAGTFKALGSFFAYDGSFRGGVDVAVGFVDPQAVGANIVTGAGPGGGPHVKVFGDAFEQVDDFFAFDANQNFGVRVAVAEDPDMPANTVVASQGPGGGTEVRSFALGDAKARETFAAFQPGFRGGVEGAVAPPTLRVRKDIADLTAQEKADFVAAILLLKEAPSPYDSRYNYYDQFVAWHREQLTEVMGGHSMADGEPHEHTEADLYQAHMGPGFGPWHRIFVNLFEKALRDVSGKDIALPYWNWTDPRSTAAAFAPDVMGGDGDPDQNYAVVDGPFQKGRFVLETFGPTSNDPLRLPYVTRAFGTQQRFGATLPTPADLAAALAIDEYDVAPFDITSDYRRSFRGNLEGFRNAQGMTFVNGVMTPIIDDTYFNGMHDRVHFHTGGQFTIDGVVQTGAMVPITSPNDPIFFLHHNFVDKVWADWGELHGNDYQPVTGGPAGRNYRDPMFPFVTYTGGIEVARTTPEQVLTPRALGFRFAD